MNSAGMPKNVSFVIIWPPTALAALSISCTVLLSEGESKVLPLWVGVPSDDGVGGGAGRVP